MRVLTSLLQGGTVSSDDNFSGLSALCNKAYKRGQKQYDRIWNWRRTHRQASQTLHHRRDSSAHDGSLAMLYSFVDLAKEIGADAIKFQIHFKAESTWDEEFRVNIFPQDKTRYEYWQRMEFTPDQWARLFEHAKNVGLSRYHLPFLLRLFKCWMSLG